MSPRAGYLNIDGSNALQSLKPVLAFTLSLCAGFYFVTTLGSQESMAYTATTTTVPSSTIMAQSRIVASQKGPVSFASREGPAAAGALVNEQPNGASTVGAPVASLTVMGCAILAAASFFVLSKKDQTTDQLNSVDLNSLYEAQPSWVMASTTGTKSPIYVINGFYMAMREKYTQDGAAILYMLAEWDSSNLAWKDFRGKVLGATDPATAPEGSIRRTILETYKELGLATEPNVGDNGVHASASPFEALVERMNWIGAQLETDGFGNALLEAGIPKETILAWTKDPQVEFEGQKRGLFDVMEDLNVQDCLKRAQTIAGVSGPITATKNQAFVFVKPHAMSPKAIELAQSKLKAAGITLGESGRLDNKTIESKMLIDNHYYAIANKASLTKPKDLNPPSSKQDEFATLFGEKWADVLAAGRVFNALDACKELGITGNGLDDIWGVAKKSGKLVKFGGGFYVGQLNP